MSPETQNLKEANAATEATGAIFISYRRQDSQGFAGRLADGLADIFGDAQIFRDDEIPEGRDYTAVLSSALDSCRVLIVVIGPRWVGARNESGQPRLADPGDWVRFEVEQALARGRGVLPVLVGGAKMPTEADVPPGMAELCRIQGVETSDRSWNADMEHLAKLLRQRVPSLPPQAIPTGPKRAIRPLPPRRTTVEHWADQLGRLLQGRPSGPRRLLMRPLMRPLVNIVKRLIFTGVGLLLAYFVLERYASAEVRIFVYDFFRFAWEFILSLWNRLISRF